MQEGFAACAQRNQVLEDEVQKVTRIAGVAREDQSTLAKKFNKETAQRITAEIKLA